MSVDREEVRRIADLAKLELADDEVGRLADEMSRILDHAQRLQEVEEATGAGADAVDGDPPPGALRWEGNPMDPDPLVHPLHTVAPDLRDGFFAVPRPPGVVDGEGDDSSSDGEAADTSSEGG